MSISMSRVALPVITQYLSNLSGLLDKAEAHAIAQKIDPRVLLDARLFPDMFALSRQVQLACDFSKGAVTRLAGIANPSFDDTETTFAELRTRIGKTLDIVRAIKAEQIDGSEERDITLKVAGNPVSFRGEPYLIGFAIPNVIFHVTTAYAIMRHNGVVLGKADFIGPANNRT